MKWSWCLAAAGGVGLAAVEIARHLGARVIAAAGGEEKCELARAHGAHETIDYRKDGWGAQIKALSRDRGADVIVDPVGGSHSKEALRAHRVARTIACRRISHPAKFRKFPPIGCCCSALPRLAFTGITIATPHMLARVSKTLTTFAQNGVIRPHVDVYPFEDLPRALADLARHAARPGKAVLTNRYKGP